MFKNRRVASFLVGGSTNRNGPVDDGNAFPESFATTKIADAVNWARKYSFFTYPFVTACCGMEYFSVAGPRYDIDRFGAALPRFTPRQSDLLFVVGTITQRQAPILRRVYEQMAEPKWWYPSALAPAPAVPTITTRCCRASTALFRFISISPDVRRGPKR
jgi:hypothetical protein